MIFFSRIDRDNNEVDPLALPIKQVSLKINYIRFSLPNVSILLWIYCADIGYDCSKFHWWVEGVNCYITPLCKF